MKVAFLGTSDFAVPSLRLLAHYHEVAVVVTAPDRPGDRGKPAPRPVADMAREFGLPLFQPEKLKNETAKLLDFGVDALVVAAYGQILPVSLLGAVKFGGINVHASLLPRWRGAAPIAFAILNGDAKTGVSIMKMEAGLDTGPFYSQAELAIARDATTPSLTAELAELGATTLVATMKEIEAGTAELTNQDESLVTVAPRIKKEAANIKWSEMSAIEVDRHVRAMQPWPGTKAPINGVEVEICSGQALTTHSGGNPGQVVGQDRICAVIATKEGDYRVDEVKPPSKPKMEASAFLRGRGN